VSVELNAEIGNPPFSDRTVRSDRAFRSLGLRLHDYFIVKVSIGVEPIPRLRGSILQAE